MSATGRGFQLEYPSITLHAISRGEQGPSIYCQLDDTVNAAENAKPQNDEEDVADMSELTILPKDPFARASASFCARSCTHDIPQSSLYSRRSPSAHPSIPTLARTTRWTTTTTRSSIPASSRPSTGPPTRSSARSGGCAAISSIIAVSPRTRHRAPTCFFFAPVPPQAALSHLESIIYNPFDKPAPTEQFEDAPEQEEQKPEPAEIQKEKSVANGEPS